MSRAEERAGRLVALLEYLNRADGPVPVSELIDLAQREFRVSEVTLRADLAALCALRGVRKAARASFEARDEGGPPVLGRGSLFQTRLQRRAEEKLAIARRVTRVLEEQPDLRVLLLDAGTTAYYVADLLSERKGLDLIVWTPGVAAACRLAESGGVSARLLGGEYQPDYGVVCGDETARSLRALAGPDEAGRDLEAPLPQFPGVHCVLDINHLSADGGLYTDESRERLQKRLMTELADDLTVIADRTKLFGRQLGVVAHEVARLSALASRRSVRLVTDAGLDGQGAAALEALFRSELPGFDTATGRDEGAVWVEATRPQAPPNAEGE